MKSNNETYSLNSLTKEEVKTILESLLFSSSVDVCASFYKEESLNTFELAKKIRIMFPEIILDNINVTKISDEKNDMVYHDEHTSEIVKYFPEILEETLIN
jgi:hypothetical protein